MLNNIRLYGDTLVILVLILSFSFYLIYNIQAIQNLCNIKNIKSDYLHKKAWVYDLIISNNSCINIIYHFMI